MWSSIPPAVRHLLPPVVLAVAALSSVVLALQLLVLAPELVLIAASLLGAGALQALAAWGLYRERFWARGFGLGALLSTGVGVGIWLTPSGIAVSSTLLAVVLLLLEDAPGRYERRAAFLAQHQMSAAGARRLFWAGLGLGVALPSMLGSVLSFTLWLTAPVPFAVAVGLALLALLGLTRLASWYWFATLGAALALLVAVVLSAAGDPYTGVWSALLAAAMGAAALPFAGPVARALRA